MTEEVFGLHTGWCSMAAPFYCFAHGTMVLNKSVLSLASSADPSMIQPIAVQSSGSFKIILSVWSLCSYGFHVMDLFCLYFMHECFACLRVCAGGLCLVSTEDGRGCQIP